MMTAGLNSIRTVTGCGSPGSEVECRFISSPVYFRPGARGSGSIAFNFRGSRGPAWDSDWLPGGTDAQKTSSRPSGLPAGMIGAPRDPAFSASALAAGSGVYPDGCRPISRHSGAGGRHARARTGWEARRETSGRPTGILSGTHLSPPRRDPTAGSASRRRSVAASPVLQYLRVGTVRHGPAGGRAGGDSASGGQGPKLGPVRGRA